MLLTIQARGCLTDQTVRQSDKARLTIKARGSRVSTQGCAAVAAEQHPSCGSKADSFAASCTGRSNNSFNKMPQSTKMGCTGLVEAKPRAAPPAAATKEDAVTHLLILEHKDSKDGLYRFCGSKAESCTASCSNRGRSQNHY